MTPTIVYFEKIYSKLLLNNCARDTLNTDKVPNHQRPCLWSLNYLTVTVKGSVKALSSSSPEERNQKKTRDVGFLSGEKLAEFRQRRENQKFLIKNPSQERIWQ